MFAVVGVYRPMSISSTRLPATTTLRVDPLERYHLSAFAWLAPLLRPDDTIHLKTNSTEETLKLSTDDVVSVYLGLLRLHLFSNLVSIIHTQKLQIDSSNVYY